MGVGGGETGRHRLSGIEKQLSERKHIQERAQKTGSGSPALTAQGLACWLWPGCTTVPALAGA